MKNQKVLLSFDLDFTLINNQEGIIASFNHALDLYHLPLISEKEILSMIGMPLKDMFKRVSDKDPDVLCQAFREYYGSKGIYQVKLFSGVVEKLEELKTTGYSLGIITSKKEEMAVKLLNYLNVSQLFKYIKGESKIMKSKLDPNLMRFLRENFPDHAIIIVGDHPNDALLADNLKAPFIGVLTGHFDDSKLRNNLPKGLKYHILSSMTEIDSEIINSLL